MNIRLTKIKFAIVLCGTFVATVVFGQTTRIWTGGNGAGIEIGVATNWDTGLPSTALGDTAQWNGTVPGNLSLVYNTNTFQSGFQQSGINLHLTSSQTGAVSISRTPGMFGPVGGPIAIYHITIDAGAGAFTFGGSDLANRINWVGRPAGAIHQLINNSTNTATLTPWIWFTSGGGAVWTMAYSGTGDWQCNSYLNDNGGPGYLITVAGPGTVFWNPTGFLGSSGIASPITINGGTLVLQGPHPRLANQAITMNGNFIFNPTNPAAAQTLSGVISGGGVLKVGNGTLTLSGANTYTGGTIISGGTLQVGTNGPSGSLGGGNVTNHSVILFNRSNSVTFANAISGTGSVVKTGAGILMLTGANIYSGNTTVSNGTLIVSSVGGDMNLNGGTLATTVVGSVGTLNVAGSMNISAGTVLVTLNKTSSPSNSLVSVGGGISSSGGTVTLLNFGPAVVVGDKFTLFNQPVAGGAAMPMVSPGFSVANNLAVDGSVTVTAVAPPAIITPTLSGGILNLSWPAAWTGLHLQAQTNPLTIGLSTNWVAILGSDATNNYATTVNPNASVFYRLAP